MKQLYKVVAIITVIVAIWLLPDENTEVIEPIEIKAFEVTIEGAVLRPKTITLYESTSWDVILSYVGGYYQVKKDFIPKYTTINKSMTIIIPFEESETIEEFTLININQANFQTLLQIPYMTETRAAELIIYRQIHGAFNSIEELIHVKYIGVQTLENMRPYISIS